MGNINIVAIEIVDGCNLNCSFCARNSQIKQKDYISSDKMQTFLKLIDDMKEKPFIALTGGEPLLYDNIINLLDTIENHHLKYSITTNGTLLDFTLLKWLSKSKYFRHFIISVDSCFPDRHDRIRGVLGSFEKTKSFIDATRKLKIPFRINMTVDNDNHNDIVQRSIWAKQNGACDISISTVRPSGRGDAHLGLADIKNIFEQIKKSEYLTDDTFSVYAAETTIFLYDFEKYKKSFEIGECYNCSFADSSLHISFNGNIKGCATCDYSLGNIYDEGFSFDHFWISNKILNMVRDKTQLTGICKTCKFVNFCGGCRCRAFAMLGSILGDDPYCPIVQKGNEYENYV